MSASKGLVAVLLTISALMAGASTTNAATVPFADATAVDLGRTHACAIRESGQAVCWGDNSDGQLGDGTTTLREFPTPVQGLTDAVAISVSGYFHHSCALRETGQVVCWGDNAVGQLGDGTRTDRLVPTPVPGLNDGISVSAGYQHSCAVRANGQALCWGYNGWGRIGDGTEADRFSFNGYDPADFKLSPSAVQGLGDAVSISAGNWHTCAIRASGQASCWGASSGGQLGDGTLNTVDGTNTTRSTTPVAVQGFGNAASISAGAGHSCGVRATGQALCWGINIAGQLGNNSNIASGSPVQVQGLANAVSISAGEDHSCAARLAGPPVCWGYNGGGGIGDGTTTDRSVPTVVLGISQATTVAAGHASCGIQPPGDLYCWGAGVLGRGNPADTTVANPVLIEAGDPPLPEFDLSVATTGDGQGFVTSVPGGISCGSDCGEEYEEGTQVTLRAEPQSGSIFSGWSGDCTGQGECSVSMDRSRQVAAEFTKLKEPIEEPVEKPIDKPVDKPIKKPVLKFVRIMPAVLRLNSPGRGGVTVKVKNIGDVTAVKLKVCVKGPRAVVSGGKVCWSGGSLAAGQVKAHRFPVKMPKRQKKGMQFRLSFAATAVGADSQKSASTVRVR